MSNTYDLNRIGERIRSERTAAGLSLKETAEEVGCSRQLISKWEKGEGTVFLNEMLKMCNLFNCELGYLLCEYDCKTREATDIQKITGLSEEVINKLKSWADPPENVDFILRAYIDFFNEIIPQLPTTLANNFNSLQNQRENLPAQSTPFTMDGIDEMLDAVRSLQEQYPSLCVINHKTAAQHFITEIVKDIEKILRKDLDFYG